LAVRPAARIPGSSAEWEGERIRGERRREQPHRAHGLHEWHLRRRERHADRVTRLLFLIADTGGGHRAAATAVARHLETTEPGRYAITILDPFADAGPRVVRRTADLYGPLTRHARWAWGALYHATNSRAAVAVLSASALRVASTDAAVRASRPIAATTSGSRSIRRSQRRFPRSPSAPSCGRALACTRIGSWCWCAAERTARAGSPATRPPLQRQVSTSSS